MSLAAPVLHITDGQKDLSVNKYSLTYYADTIIGHRMEIDGIGDYIGNNTANWRSSDNQGSILAWIYRMDGNVGTLFASADAATDLYYLDFEIRHNDKLAIIQRNNDVVDIVQGTTILAQNQWYHVAIVSNGTAYSLYVNGVAETPSVTSGANTGDWLSDTPNRDNFTIAAIEFNALPTVQHFNGKIGEMKNFDFAVTADFVAIDYKQSRRRY